MERKERYGMQMQNRNDVGRRGEHEGEEKWQ